MHAAPPVRVSLGRSPGWSAFVAAASAATAANLVWWLCLQLDLGLVASLVATVDVAVVAGVAIAISALREASTLRVLQWDGGQWHWTGLAGQARVTVDLDAWMLLRFDSTLGTTRWIAASRRATNGSWGALRGALFAPPPADPLALPPT